MKTTVNDDKPPNGTYDGHRAMQIQLARLLGAESKHARTFKRSGPQWRKTLRAALSDIDRYVAVNVDTDELHRSMLLSGLAAAAESLKQEDFWPGYAEGITRLALILLGDYTDHRRRKYGRKQDSHYRLDRARSVLWVQTPEQRFTTLLDVGSVGFPQLSAKPRDVLFTFRQKYGNKPNHAQFIEWFRVHFPEDYVAVFR